MTEMSGHQTQTGSQQNNHQFLQTITPSPDPLPPPISSTQPTQISREEFLKFGLPLYQATLHGNWPAAEHILAQSRDWIRRPIGKGLDTALHIAAAAKHVQFVAELVRLMEVNDLALKNEAQNTALCLAATSGVVEIARMMVNKSALLPNIRGSQGMPPLQMAVLLGCRDMVWYLLSVTDDSQLKDKDRIAILTSSIDTELFDVANHILRAHPELAILRDGKKETALHALARRPLQPGGYHERSMWERLIRLGSVAQGSPPLKKLELQLVRSLWSKVIKQDDQEISQLIGRPWRLLFVAAKFGYVDFLVTLISAYPDLIWKVDEDNHSIFHIAIMYRHEEIFKVIHELGAMKELIAIDKDCQNNNMLHLAAALAPSDRLNCVSGAAFQMQRELLWFKEVEKVVRPEYTEEENKDHKTPRALFTEKHEELRTKGEEWMKKTAELATLIATVVFTAAFTLPGVTGSAETPVLVRRPLFIVFAIFNAISLFSSCSSVLMFFSILTSRYAEQDFLRSLPLKLMLGLTGLFVSIATLMVAFTATFFMTFRKGINWIPIPIALIASVPVGLFALQQYPLLRDIYLSTYRSSSLFRPSKAKLFPIYSSQ